MAVTLFTFVDLYMRLLDTTAHLVDKGTEYAAAHGVADGDLLAWRLIDDMQPFAFQLMVVCNFSRQWPARVAGISVPLDISADLSISEFRKEIAAAKTFLSGLEPAQFADRDDVPITFTIGTGMTLTLTGGQWLTVFATTNLYFHVTTAYAILRAHGVSIGKVDMFPSGL